MSKWVLHDPADPVESWFAAKCKNANCRWATRLDDIEIFFESEDSARVANLTFRPQDDLIPMTLDEARQIETLRSL